MNSLTIKEALPGFYKEYGIEPDGGINEEAVRVELLKGIYIYVPNLDVRRRVLLRHDIHHLLTGYSGKMKGETEISAWELSTGCTHNWFAFTINTLGMMTGVPFNIWGIWKAWKRGKYTQNLYSKNLSDKALLDLEVTGLKKELGLQKEARKLPNTFRIILSFLVFLIFGTVFSLASLLIAPFMLIYSLGISFRNLFRKK